MLQKSYSSQNSCKFNFQNILENNFFAKMSLNAFFGRSKFDIFRLLCENFIGHSGSGSWSNQKTYLLTITYFCVLQPILGDKF